MISVDVVGVGLMGAGRAGLVHGRNFANAVPDARLVALVDPDASAAQAAAGELGARPYADVDEFLADPRLDAVVITAPTFAHADLVRRAAQAGKHILCEKPLTLRVEDALTMNDAVQAAGGRFLMGFMRRYDEAFRRAREAIRRGDIGQPVLVKSTGRGPGLPPAWAHSVANSNGLLGEVNSHDVDSVRWLTGAEFKWVFARAGNFKSPELAGAHPDFYDHVVVSFGLSNGELGTVDGSCPCDYGYDARVEVQGTAGVLFIGSSAQHGVEMVTRAPGAVRPAVASWRSLFREAYQAEDRHLIELIRNPGLAPQCALEDGLRALEVVLAANRSVVSGNPEPVQLNPIGGTNG